mgnify:CR=1 FL=1
MQRDFYVAPEDLNGAESGDKVLVELSPYDLSRGRITYRYK